ncbi:Heterokaryon incompatibility protein (HET) domain containing protein [Rhypophila sp. PSN 637]
MSLAKRRRWRKVSRTLPVRCRFCTAMTRLAKKPLDYQQYRRPSGKARKLSRSRCKAHTAIVDKCQELMRANYDQWTIKLEKDALQRTVRVGPNDVLGFRLALLPSSQHSSNPQYCGRRVHPSWIDMDVVRNWRTICDRHHPECRNGAGSVINHVRSHSERPALLIDAELMCICEVTDNMQHYLALSYVWGGSRQLKLSTATLADLMQAESLLRPHYNSKIPKTIRDAIGLVRVLGERYLWVDALCIIQDDERHTRRQLQAMASIYAHATITIVAAQGGSANRGLHGIPNISSPRSFHQARFRIANGRTFVHCRDLWQPEPHWSKRGWTHQESLFSVRKLMFVGDSIEWHCRCAIFREDLKEGDVRIPISEQRIHGFRHETSQQRLLHPRLPDVDALTAVIDQYLSRDFTYPADILPAFAGLSFVLSNVFDGGFLFGIPEMFFDAALLWTAYMGGDKLRDDKNITSKLALPSWSWMGWAGLKHFMWFEAFDHAKWALSGYWSSVRTVPLVEWYSGTGRLASKARRIPNHWRRYADVASSDLPPGWTVHKNKSAMENTHHQPKHFYKHESDPKLEFWYPIPLVAHDPDACRVNTLQDSPSPFISCSTTRAHMTLGERFEPRVNFQSTIDVAVYDRNGTWAGYLNIPSLQDVSLEPETKTNDEGDPPATKTTCELAAISMGWAYNNDPYGLVEWNHPGRPREGEKYEWYNVMWIQWHGDAARRKGVGRIAKEVWEVQGLEEINLVLN